MPTMSKKSIILLQNAFRKECGNGEMPKIVQKRFFGVIK